MKIKNVSPLGDIDVPLLGRIVKAGEVFEASAEDAPQLLEQPFHFKRIAPAKTVAAKPAKEGETK